MKRGFRDLPVLEHETLYVGFDNSNHAGKRRGEIIVATFSFNVLDAIVKNFGKNRDYASVEKWINDPVNPRDYRFCSLIDEKYRHIHQNIPHAAPFLVRSFLDKLKFEVPNVFLYFDGELEKWHENYLRQVFKPCFRNIGIEYFIKKRGIHNCPMPVYVADVLSNDLYNGGFSEVAEHPKGVIIKNSISRRE